MAEGSNEETVKFKVELDPQGFRSQLLQLKQEIGLTLNAATHSFGQSVSDAGVGFNSMSRDMSALAGAVFNQRTPSQDLSQSSSMISGLVPGLTAPRSYDVEEWGKLNRNNLFNSVADFSHGAALAALPVGMGELGGAFGSGVGSSLGGLPGALVGGLAGYMGGTALGETVMEPAYTRYAAGKALRSAGARYGVSATDEVLAGVTQIAEANQMSGTEALGVLQAGLQTGAMGQMGGADDFKQKFRQLMQGAREISRDMHIELTESVQHIASMQSAGFGTIQGAVGAMRMARTTSALTGIHTEEAVALAQAGAGMAVGNLGMSAQYGASSTLANFESVTLGLRNKSLDLEAVNQLGGRARAAQAMTMSGIGYLESSLGRATLMAAYDTDTGQLDSSKYVAEPGMAFRSAMDNVMSGANPMKTLLEFAGNRSRVASQASPEEVALSQTMTWATLARNIDPKGPVTQDMLVGAATVMGTNPDVARSIVATTLDPSIPEARREEVRKQQVLAEQRNAPYVGGIGPWASGGSFTEEVQKTAESFYTGFSAANVGRSIGGTASGIASFFGMSNVAGMINSGSSLAYKFLPSGTRGHLEMTPETYVNSATAAMRRASGAVSGVYDDIRGVIGGRQVPRIAFEPGQLASMFSNDSAADIAGSKLEFSEKEREGIEINAVQAITAVLQQAGDETTHAATPDTRAVYQESLGEIMAIRGERDPEAQRRMTNKLLKSTEGRFSLAAQHETFGKAVQLTVAGGSVRGNSAGSAAAGALGTMVGGVARLGGLSAYAVGVDIGTSLAKEAMSSRSIGAIDKLASMQASDETSMAGLRFLIGSTSRGGSSYEEIAGKGWSNRENFKSVLSDVLSVDKEAIISGPMRGMWEDNKTLSRAVGDGAGIPLARLEGMSFQAATLDGLRAADLDKNNMLSKEEISRAQDYAVRRYAVTQAKLGGPTSTGSVDPSQIILYNKLGTLIESINKLVANMAKEKPSTWW